MPRAPWILVYVLACFCNHLASGDPNVAPLQIYAIIYDFSRHVPRIPNIFPQCTPDYPWLSLVSHNRSPRWSSTRNAQSEDVATLRLLAGSTGATIGLRGKLIGIFMGFFWDSVRLNKFPESLTTINNFISLVTTLPLLSNPYLPIYKCSVWFEHCSN